MSSGAGGLIRPVGPMARAARPVRIPSDGVHLLESGTPAAFARPASPTTNDPPSGNPATMKLRSSLVRSALVASALAALMVAAGPSRSIAQDQFGTIKGRLVWGGKDAPAPRKLGGINKDPQVCAVKPLIDRGLVVDPKTKGIKDSFAYLVNPKGKNPAAEKAILDQGAQVVIDQKNCEFVPHVAAALKGQTFVFKSSDPVGHNVHYTGFSNSGNFAIAANGTMDKKLVPEKRQIELKCDIHPWMKGYLMVLDHPFFAITRDDGSFEIKGVPAGPQKLIVWQEKVGYVTEGRNQGKAVTVKAGETVDIGDVVLDPTKVKD
jgi:plastocyanin